MRGTSHFQSQEPSVSTVYRQSWNSLSGCWLLCPSDFGSEMQDICSDETRETDRIAEKDLRIAEANFRMLSFPFLKIRLRSAKDAFEASRMAERDHDIGAAARLQRISSR